MGFGAGSDNAGCTVTSHLKNGSQTVEPTGDPSSGEAAEKQSSAKPPARWIVASLGRIFLVLMLLPRVFDIDESCFFEFLHLIL